MEKCPNRGSLIIHSLFFTYVDGKPKYFMLAL